MAETGESENGEAAEALPPEDESPAVAAELVADQDDGTVPGTSPTRPLSPITLATATIVTTLEYCIPIQEARFAHPHIRSRKRLQIDNKKLVDICTRAGITGKGSALASLTDEEVARLKTYMAGGRGKADGAAAKTASPGPGRSIRREDYIAPAGTVGTKVPVLPPRQDKPPLLRKKAEETAPPASPAIDVPPVTVPAVPAEPVVHAEPAVRAESVGPAEPIMHVGPTVPVELPPVAPPPVVLPTVVPLPAAAASSVPAPLRPPPRKKRRSRPRNPWRLPSRCRLLLRRSLSARSRPPGNRYRRCRGRWKGCWAIARASRAKKRAARKGLPRRFRPPCIWRPCRRRPRRPPRASPRNRLRKSPISSSLRTPFAPARPAANRFPSTCASTKEEEAR